METLQWPSLLSDKRERPSNQANVLSGIVRNAFEADYDKIIGSSSVRRLQDKAQVFPLQEDDVTRTRLTHSIEVSALARSLGKAVGKELEDRRIFQRKNTEELAAILQTAGLVHDLGNPPFGHYGETVIQNWFRNWFQKEESQRYIGDMDSQEQSDFLFFDGNVQNLRILSKLQTLNDYYGANFTYAILGTIVKYPWTSTNCGEKNKKFGYFKTEQNLYDSVSKELGLANKVRHPATYLLEAADDIIYLCDDIEDGVKKGYVLWGKEYPEIKKKVLKKQPSEDYIKLFDRIEKKVPDKDMDAKEIEVAEVRNFRNYVQSYLFSKAISSFFENYEKIMSNQEYGGLDLLSGEKPLIKELKEVTKNNCFQCREVVSLELAGERIIGFLLNTFVPSILSATAEELLDSRSQSGKLFSLISKNFIYVALHPHYGEEKEPVEIINGLTTCEKLHLIIDFISGMTDTYAFKLYQELSGIRKPI